MMRNALSVTMLVIVACAGVSLADPVFDASAAVKHIRALSVEIGVRKGGSAAEERARNYIIDCMRKWGYLARLRAVPLPNGRFTENLIFERSGKKEHYVIVGAHVDSKPPSPGANDNGSGVATVLEIARALRDVDTPLGVRYVFFGAEEVQGSDPNGHHYGSRYYAAHLSTDDNLTAMICIDSVAAGPHYVIGDMHGNSPLAADLRATARALGYHVLNQKDPGWSDHQPFEDAGYTVAYVRWRVDPTLHTAGDNFAHVQKDKIAQAGNTVLRFLTHHTNPYPGGP